MPPDKPPRPGPCGILVVDKPAGMSSMRVVAAVRRKAGGVRTGHAGTLDPEATGVLVLALGRATKSIARLMDTEKRYETRIDLSAFTVTDDREGELQPVAVDTPPDEQAVRDAVLSFSGTFEQRPPAFSAVKVGGRRAYKLARRGAPVELPPRPVTVHEIELVGYEWPFVDVRLRCEKGFYVRSLARDLGERLETGGHCVTIRRTAVGPFTIEAAVPLDDVAEPLDAGALIDLDRALAMAEASDGAA